MNIGDKVYAPLFDKVFELIDIDEWPHDEVVGMKQTMLYCSPDTEAWDLHFTAFKPFEVEKL